MKRLYSVATNAYIWTRSNSGMNGGAIAGTNKYLRMPKRLGLRIGSHLTIKMPGGQKLNVGDWFFAMSEMASLANSHKPSCPAPSPSWRPKNLQTLKHDGHFTETTCSSHLAHSLSHSVPSRFQSGHCPPPPNSHNIRTDVGGLQNRLQHPRLARHHLRPSHERGIRRCRDVVFGDAGIS